MVARDEPLAPGERRLPVRDYDAAVALVRGYDGVPAALQHLRAVVAADLCAPVHQLSDAGLLREVAARIHRGDLEVRRAPAHIPETFPHWQRS